jgi:hypothetical protein
VRIFQKPPKVVVKDRLAPVAAIHHMINRTGIFDAQLSWHPDQLNLPTQACKQSGLTPLKITPILRLG